MSSQELHDLVKRYDEEVINKRNYDALPSLVTDDFVDHGAWPGTPGGPAGARIAVESMVAGIPDLKVVSEDTVAEGDLVAFRSTVTGTHSGPLFGMPPSGKPIEVTSVQMWRVADGKLAERWIRTNVLPLLPTTGYDQAQAMKPEWTNQPMPEPHRKDPNPDVAKNKAHVAEYNREVVDKHDPEGVRKYMATDAIDHGAPAGFPQGHEGAALIFRMYWGAFPNIKYEVKDVIGEGDKIMLRAQLSGTQEGDFMGIPATHKPVSIMALQMLRLSDGLIVEHWGGIEDLLLFQQLGVVPGAAPAGQSS